jgi:hypothetical protein
MKSQGILREINLSGHRNASIALDIKTSIWHWSGAKPRPETDQRFDRMAVDCSKTLPRAKGEGKGCDFIWNAPLAVSTRPKFWKNRKAFGFCEFTKISDATAAGWFTINKRQNMCRMMIVAVEFMFVGTTAFTEIYGGTDRHYFHQIVPSTNGNDT